MMVMLVLTPLQMSFASLLMDFGYETCNIFLEGICLGTTIDCDFLVEKFEKK